jgi:uncharacterized RDD family membrane protein YckC
MTNLYAPPRAAVRDVVDPAAKLVLADRGTRLGASILDSFVAAAMIAGPAVVFGIAGAAASTSGSSSSSIAALGLVLSLVGAIAWVWLTIRFLIKNGQSIAKKLLGIKVVRVDGSRASISRIFWLRNILNGFISIVPLYGLLDSLFIFGESRQCLHDKIADTIVINA